MGDLSGDQVAIMAQTAPILLLVIVAERRWLFSPMADGRPDRAMAVAQAVAAVALAGVTGFAHFGVDQGLDGFWGWTTSLAYLGGVMVVLGSLLGIITGSAVRGWRGQDVDD